MRKRILVVEDDPAQRETLAAFLKGEKFYVETAVDGLDAVERARLGWFDVILMDYRLPEVDGLAAARLISDLTRDHGSPNIIAVTGYRDAIFGCDEGAQGGFFSVVSKPWEAETLLDAIRNTEAARPPAGSPWPAPRQAAGPVVADKLGNTWRILIVDDEELPRRLLTAALGAHGYHVDEASDGLQAVLMVGNQNYDAAIIDYGLPKVNGVAAARLISDLLAQADRPRLIALTAHPALIHDKEDGFTSAFDAIVGKSHGLEAVIGAVEWCLKSKRPPSRVPRTPWLHSGAP